MNILNNWITWVIIYLISAVLFAQSYKIANRNMKNAGSLTVLTELFTALFAILFIPFFKFTLPTNYKIYITLLIVTIIYAITDRLNIEARYGLETSTFSMLKQLSTVFLIIFGLVILKEKFVLKKVIGAAIIIIANLILTFNKGKITINKYFIMSVCANFLFAVAMLINVNISDNFNLAFYTIITVTIPAIFISIFEKQTVKKLKEEFNLYNKKIFLLATFSWCVMLISSVKAYQLGQISIVAPLFAMTSILNSLMEFIHNKDIKKLGKHLLAAILIIIGVILIKI